MIALSDFTTGYMTGIVVFMLVLVIMAALNGGRRG